MGDPLKKVKAGDALEVPANAWNAFVDAAVAHQTSRDELGNLRFAFHQATVVPMENKTGSDQDRFAVLGIDGPVWNANDARLVLEGVTPNCEDYKGRFAILAEPIPAGKIGRAVVGGVSAVRITVAAEDDADYAEVGGRTTRLWTKEGGSAYVLWRAGGTGQQWAIVRLGRPDADFVCLSFSPSPSPSPSPAPSASPSWSPSPSPDTCNDCDPALPLTLHATLCELGGDFEPYEGDHTLTWVDTCEWRKVFPLGEWLQLNWYDVLGGVWELQLRLASGCRIIWRYFDSTGCDPWSSLYVRSECDDTACASTDSCEDSEDGTAVVSESGSSCPVSASGSASRSPSPSASPSLSPSPEPCPEPPDPITMTMSGHDDTLCSGEVLCSWVDGVRDLAYSIPDDWWEANPAVIGWFRVKYQSGQWEFWTEKCGIKFVNSAADSDCPPKAGWVEDTGCGDAEGTLTIDY